MSRDAAMAPTSARRRSSVLAIDTRISKPTPRGVLLYDAEIHPSPSMIPASHASLCVILREPRSNSLETRGPANQVAPSNYLANEHLLICWLRKAPETEVPTLVRVQVEPLRVQRVHEAGRRVRVRHDVGGVEAHHPEADVAGRLRP